MTLIAVQKTGQIETRHLHAFIAAWEERSFGRAAERLALLQPRLSLLIRRLEEIVGEQLLVRRPVVQLTPAGSVFLPYARRATAELIEGIEAAAQAARGEIGSITIGYPTWVAPTTVPKAIAIFRQQYPKVELRLRTMATADQLTELKAGRLDLIFMRDIRLDPEIEARLLFEEPWVIALPPEHPLTARPEVRAEDLEDQAMISYPPSFPWIRKRVDRFFQPELRVRTVQEAQSWFAILSLVKAGLGFAVVPHSQMLMWGQDLHWAALRPSRMTQVSAGWLAGATNASIPAFLRILSDTSKPVSTMPHDAQAADEEDQGE
jgi:DNA-binding transcriptional LysR family regulator